MFHEFYLSFHIILNYSLVIVFVDKSTLYHAKTPVVFASFTDTLYMLSVTFIILKVTPCSVPYSFFTNSITFSSSVFSVVCSVSSTPT